MNQRYYARNPFQIILGFLKNLPANILKGIINIGKGIALFFYTIFAGIGKFFSILIKGDFRTKFSFLIMGFGNAFRGQIVRGFLYLAIQLCYFMFMINFGWDYLKNIKSLGNVAMGETFDESQGIYIMSEGDNSMKILLFSVVTLVISFAFLIFYCSNVFSSYKAQKLQENGKTLPKFKDDVKALFNEKYHITLLSLPTIMVISFTVLPIIFMICIAFTNFDKNHQPPGNLFTWVGFENFKNLFISNKAQSTTLWMIFRWTIVWAFFATFTNYIFGMILAMIINKKGIKLKSMWRTIFVVTIAVPQFVTLMLMSRIFADQGPANAILMNLGWIHKPIQFLTTVENARKVVIGVNMWIGIPFTMLITTGILMNIPEEMYESAKIDGASAFKMFTKITLPYMLFITGPYLITQFVGNINNFNVIYLLTGGGPTKPSYWQAGQTDLLVTWLYKLTVNERNYSIASTIGIFVFVISAGLSLIVYNMSASTRKEDQFK